MDLPRLDILLSCHDGRGLGHASRTIAIGMACRRLFPQLRLMFVSGCAQTAELVGTCPLEWCKLPSYRTKVVNGTSTGADGYCNYTDAELGALRASSLRHLVELYRPRLLLADHTPQGKHRELLPALTAARAVGCQAVLGMRGVIGSVPQVRSGLAAAVFQEHYRGLLWYGDAAVLGEEHCRLLAEQFGCRPVETGYVSRLDELRRLGSFLRTGPSLAGTISLPRMGTVGRDLLANLSSALTALGDRWGQWHLYLYGDGHEGITAEAMRLPDHCRLRPFGPAYFDSLVHSRMAVIYGGYNSIVDVLAARIPALVILREMVDREQQLHLEQLAGQTGGLFIALPESAACSQQLAPILRQRLEGGSTPVHAIALDGAERAARFCQRLLDEPE